MYATAARAKKFSQRTRLTVEFKFDLHWWHLFVTSWNGISLLHNLQQSTFDYRLWTDVSGIWGCGVRFGDQWLQFRWPPDWTPIAIMAKELVSIVLSCSVWGKLVKQKNVQFFVWQSLSCRVHSERCIERHRSQASLEMPVVFYSSLQHSYHGHTSPRGSKHRSWLSVQEQASAILYLTSNGISSANSNPTLPCSNCVTNKTWLDFSSLS